MAARSLFAAARSLMRAQDQLRASLIIDAHFVAGARLLRGRARRGRARRLHPRCAALNRKGKPCGREPIWGTPFCVSHTGGPV